MAPSRVDAVRLAALEMVGSGAQRVHERPCSHRSRDPGTVQPRSRQQEAAQEYIDQACTCFDQNIDVMASDGTLGSTPLSYTQGTCMEAGRLIC